MSSLDRAALLAQLVRTPDPFDGWRTSKRTQEGDPRRHELIARQRVVYHQHQIIAREDGQ